MATVVVCLSVCLVCLACIACLVLPCPVLACLVLSCRFCPSGCSCLVLDLPCLVTFACLVLFVVFCSALSCLALSCFDLSDLSCPVLFWQPTLGRASSYTIQGYSSAQWVPTSWLGSLHAYTHPRSSSCARPNPHCCKSRSAEATSTCFPAQGATSGGASERNSTATCEVSWQGLDHARSNSGPSICQWQLAAHQPHHSADNVDGSLARPSNPHACRTLSSDPELEKCAARTRCPPDNVWPK